MPVFIAISTICAILLSSSFGMQSNQGAWAGTFPGENGQIAFDSFRDGNFEIYVMNPDGSEQTRLTNNEAFDVVPSWSPDGQKIAFTSGRDGNAEVYVMNAADGSEQTRLTNTPGLDQFPSWSPDGEKIAFVSDRDGSDEIYVMNAADGSEQTRLTNNDVSTQHPSWSPDGQKIAFASPIDHHNPDIYVINAADGSGQTRLTNNVREDNHPSWSPDGEKIAFAGEVAPNGGGNWDIWIMNAADGSDLTRLTNNFENPTSFLFAFSPSWSPDGEKIAFQNNIDGNDQIYVMNAADGSGQTNISNNPAQDRHPDWGTAAEPPAPTTPREVIDELISIIQNLDNVPQGLKTDIIAALNEVLNILNDNNPDNDELVCGMLGALIDQVNANERTDTLTADQADDLRTQAEDIRNELDC